MTAKKFVAQSQAQQRQSRRLSSSGRSPLGRTRPNQEIVMVNGKTWTPTQLKILSALADGQPHKRKDLMASCINDDQADKVVLQMHISNIRKLLRLKGEDIICELIGYSINYRHVRLLASARE